MTTNGDDNMRRILIFAFSIMVCFSTVAQPTLAGEPVIYHCENAFSDYIDYNSHSLKESYSSSEKVTYYNFNEFPKNYNSYSLLNAKQLKIFNLIKNSPVGIMSVTASYNNGEMNKSDLTQQFFTDIMNAVCHDLPQFFYHAGYSVSYSYNKYTGYVTEIIYKFVLIEVKMSINGAVKTVIPTYTEATVSDCWSELENVLNNLSFDTSNRYNFVEDVHEYLCNNVIYPSFSSSNYVGDCHDAYGALVNGYAVCQGYADAFKLICDKYKVPCVFISGSSDGVGHAWNAVQMDDGKWYLLDATWADQTWGIYYGYFLVGTETLDSSNETFSESHVRDSDLLMPALDYSKNEYDIYGNHNTEFKATYNSLVKKDGKYLIRSYFDTKENNVYYNGMYVNTENLTTNDSFNVSNDETWTLVLLGDCNGDGLSNSLDYVDAVNKAMSCVEASDAKDMAADLDCDGYVDAIDVSLLHILIKGIDTNLIIE